MDFDNLIIEVHFTSAFYEERQKSFLEHPDYKVINESEDLQLIDNAKQAIADYIKSFKRLPTKKVNFGDLVWDDYHVEYCRIYPLQNEVFCVIDF